MNADALARWYRWIEYVAFGRALEHQRFLFLDRLSAAKRILVLGEGDGRALAQLLALSPDARIDVVEISKEMIALARRRTRNSERVTFYCQDVLDVCWPDAHYDGVITCFFLDCFTEAEARSLACRLARALTPAGAWLVSDFAIPQGGWRGWNAKVWIWAMYRFFKIATGLRVQTLPPIETLLTEAGMARSASRHRRGGMIVSEIWGKAGNTDRLREVSDLVAVPEADKRGLQRARRNR